MPPDTHTRTRSPSLSISNSSMAWTRGSAQSFISSLYPITYLHCWLEDGLGGTVETHPFLLLCRHPNAVGLGSRWRLCWRSLLTSTRHLACGHVSTGAGGQAGVASGLEGGCGGGGGSLAVGRGGEVAGQEEPPGRGLISSEEHCLVSEGGPQLRGATHQRFLTSRHHLLLSSVKLLFCLGEMELSPRKWEGLGVWLWGRRSSLPCRKWNSATSSPWGRGPSGACTDRSRGSWCTAGSKGQGSNPSALVADQPAGLQLAEASSHAWLLW